MLKFHRMKSFWIHPKSVEGSFKFPERYALNISYLLEQTLRRLLNFLRCGCVVYCKVYSKVCSNRTVALIKELPWRKRWQQTMREGHWKKEERSWTCCTGKILGFHYGTAHGWSFGEREINSRAVKYSHFELKNIVCEKNKFPRLV